LPELVEIVLAIRKKLPDYPDFFASKLRAWGAIVKPFFLGTRSYLALLAKFKQDASASASFAIHILDRQVPTELLGPGFGHLGPFHIVICFGGH
jgi:hypothetical protein